jgi:hypothetical protein
LAKVANTGLVVNGEISFTLVSWADARLIALPVIAGDWTEDCVSGTAFFGRIFAGVLVFLLAGFLGALAATPALSLLPFGPAEGGNETTGKIDELSFSGDTILTCGE